MKPIFREYLENGDQIGSVVEFQRPIGDGFKPNWYHIVSFCKTYKLWPYLTEQLSNWTLNHNAYKEPNNILR